MAKKSDKQTVAPAEAAEQALEQHVHDYMGPTPEEAPSQDGESSALPEPTPIQLDDPALEPAPGAPLIPDEALKDIGTTPLTEAEPPIEVLEQPAAATDPPEVPAEPDETDEAINDIVRSESDAVLAAEDEKLAAAFAPTPVKQSFTHKLRHFLAAWWGNSKARWATIVAVVLVIIALGTVPLTRYFVLNAVGVRSTASITVLDEGTRQPLKNVQVRLAGQTAQTDSKGTVKLEQLKLGTSTLVVEKRAFAPVSREVTVGWGSNPLGEFQLTPVGSQYTFMVSDFLSAQPVQTIEASSGEASAISDKTGKIVLTIDKQNDEPLEISIKGEGYRTEDVTIDADSKVTQEVKLVPARKHVFVSKRSGKYDVYKIDADGKNEELLLAGTGNEREDMVIAPHPKTDTVAIVSTRDNQRNADGYLLSTLTIIDAKTNDTISVAQSERIQVVDWIGDRLVFVQIAAGASADNPKRYRLMSYDYDQDESQELAANNYFNDVLVAGGAIYFAPSAAVPSESGFYRINAAGNNKQKLLDQEVWNIFRVSYEDLNIAVQDEWYQYTLGGSAPTKLTGAPANPQNRMYAENPDGTQSVWADSRDGKGVLLAYDLTTKTDTTMVTASGLQTPIYWLGARTVVYRISTEQETADYVVSLDGGEPRKVRDVTNTSGIDSWYYY